MPWPWSLTKPAARLDAGSAQQAMLCEPAASPTATTRCPCRRTAPRTASCATFCNLLAAWYSRPIPGRKRKSPQLLEVFAVFEVQHRQHLHRFDNCMLRRMSRPCSSDARLAAFESPVSLFKTTFHWMQVGSQQCHSDKGRNGAASLCLQLLVMLVGIAHSQSRTWCLLTSNQVKSLTRTARPRRSTAAWMPQQSISKVCNLQALWTPWTAQQCLNFARGAVRQLHDIALGAVFVVGDFNDLHSEKFTALRHHCKQVMDTETEKQTDTEREREDDPADWIKLPTFPFMDMALRPTNFARDPFCNDLRAQATDFNLSIYAMTTTCHEALAFAAARLTSRPSKTDLRNQATKNIAEYCRILQNIAPPDCKMLQTQFTAGCQDSHAILDFS